MYCAGKIGANQLSSMNIFYVNSGEWRKYLFIYISKPTLPRAFSILKSQLLHCVSYIYMLLNVHFTLFIFDAFTFTSFYIHIWAWGNRHLFNISPSWYIVVSKQWKIFKFMIEEIMLHACCSSCCVELANKINQRASLHRSSTLLPHCYRGKISQLSHFDLKCNFAK